MNVYLAAVRSLHISHGLSNPLQPGLLLKQTLRGIKRKHFWHRSKRCRLHSTFSPIFRLLSSPRVTMTRYDGPPSPLVIFLCSAQANLQFFLVTFSIRLFTSPALTHVYIPFFWHGVSLPPTYRLKRISDDRVWPFILLIRDALSVLVALWERNSLFIFAVLPSTRLLHSCFTFPTDTPSAKYPSSLSSLTYYTKSVLTPPTTVVIVFESEEQRPPPSLA